MISTGDLPSIFRAMEGKLTPFTNHEKVLLVTLVKRESVLQSKKTDSQSIQERRRAWERITDDYNAQPGVLVPRSGAQLKKLWSNLKQRTRKARTTLQKYIAVDTTEVLFDDLDTSTSFKVIPKSVHTPPMSITAPTLAATMPSITIQKSFGGNQVRDDIRTDRGLRRISEDFDEEELENAEDEEPAKRPKVASLQEELLAVQLETAKVELLTARENLRRATVLREIAEEEKEQLLVKKV